MTKHENASKFSSLGMTRTTLSWEGPSISVDPGFSLEAAVLSSIAAERATGDVDKGLDGLFSLSPLSSPGASRSPSPEPGNNHGQQSDNTDAGTDAAGVGPTSQTNDATKPKKSRSKQWGLKSRRKRREGRHTSNNGLPTVERREDVLEKYVYDAQELKTTLATETLSVASTGYVATDAGGSKRIYKLEDLVGPGSKLNFQLYDWDGRTPTPIIDSSRRMIGLLAGHPDDPSWDSVHAEAAALIEGLRSKLNVPKKFKKHRRGNFPALAIGISHGGGQTAPGNLQNNKPNTAVLEALIGHRVFKRLSCFASDVFGTWFAKHYAYYVDRIGSLLSNNPTLKRNFIGSVFTAATFNFGPRTVCFKHTDTSNLPFGLCAITSLGNFDPDRGGHLVLWECRCVVRFPPGSTAIIPSAVVSHLNTPVARHERRYSFTQYAAGGLFRWVEHGFQTNDDYYQGMSPEEVERDEQENAVRWARGLSMFPLIDEIRRRAVVLS